MNVRVSTVVALAAALAACTDADLYSPLKPPIEADRVALSGRVCSEDPVKAQFPVRVVLVVDQAVGPLFSDFDPAGERANTISAFVQGMLSKPKVEFALVGYGGLSRKLAPIEGNFTRNVGELIAAPLSLLNQVPCTAFNVCRDYTSALNTALALIEGDMASHAPGVRGLTQYVILHVNAGPHAPMAELADCCEAGDLQCIQAGTGTPSFACQGQRDATLISSMRQVVLANGGAGLRFHAYHLAAGAGATPEEEDDLGAQMQQMAFAGAGRYTRYASIQQLSPEDFNVVDTRTPLRIKHLVVSNNNAKPTPDGPALDSDADGLSDLEEEVTLTDPTNPDTDGDDLSDLVETLLALDPLVPDTPKACQTIKPGNDADRDGLSDCEEELLGTEASLVDSDGDGMPDRLELVSATDYLHRDASVDSDGDGIFNGEEIRAHTDPRSTDGAKHLSFSYRYEVHDEGVLAELVPRDIELLTGVRLVSVSAGTTAGVGSLIWRSGDNAFQWQDALDQTPGPDVVIGAPGLYQVASSSYAPIQEDEGRFVTIEVDPAALPPLDLSEKVVIELRERHCMSYTVRNIRLMATRAPIDRPDTYGLNEVMVYVAEAPEGQQDIPGPFRLSQIPIVYRPPTFRQPGSAILEIFDDEFVNALGAY